MYRILFCVEKRDFHHLIDVAKHYAGSHPKGGYVLNNKGYQVEFYQERKINNIDCVIFGWSKFELDKYNYDIYGINSEKENLKNGYILLEFEDGFINNYKNRSKIPELKQAMNIDRIFIRDDFLAVFKGNSKEEEEEFE